MTKEDREASLTPTTNGNWAPAKDNFLSEVKELSFEDTAIQFKKTGGKWRVSLRVLAEYYGMAFSEASHKLTENKELFRDLGWMELHHRFLIFLHLCIHSWKVI